ncbi:glycosyltransferase [Oceanisphaera pacifica]|uniref:Glycosyltransferase n=1 Tax=Oceanisphaera pacifica TaxID=2818389 RepID=A0ABS3NGM9_9GAMM|nr:glycosyltransferase [Oceanisphaera pacifica]MBO1519726.1 glycosyltransferase [Oceanisphaera pacifica]
MKNKKESLLIVTPSFKGGGAEKVAVNLANQYANDGIDVTLLAVNKEGPYRKQVASNVKIVDLNCSGIIHSLFAVLFVLRKLKPIKVLSMIRETNISVGFSRFFIKINRVVFREANTLNHIYKSPWYKRLVWYLLLKFSYTQCDALVSNSEGTKAHLLKNNIIKSEKITVVDNPVLPNNVDELLKEPVDEEWLNNSEFKVVLNVGRLHEQKNQKILIHAFSIVAKELDEARLIILGEGVERKALNKLVKNLKLCSKIKILPFRDNPYPYYKGATLFALSSNYEGFGNVIVEALSSGNPVVSTACEGGPRSILKNGEYGVLVEPENVIKMAEAIKLIFLNKEAFPSKLLKARSNEYSVSVISKKYWDVIGCKSK